MKFRAKPWLGALALTENGYFKMRKEVPIKDGEIISGLEARAISMGLKSCEEHLKGSDLLILCDNQNVCLGLITGSSKNKAVNSEITRIIEWAVENDVNLFINYIRTDLNVADFLTRDSYKEIEHLLEDAEEMKPEELNANAQ